MAPSSTSSLRPGPIQGLYPQRLDDLPTALERIVGGLVGSIRQVAVGPARRARRCADAVVARETALQAASEAELDAQLDDLRRGLAHEGFTDALLVDAFALIREQAGRTLGMRHHPVQLRGGWSLVMGRVAEMNTGEGKTLTATLAAASAGLAGIPVHVVTVNDYLVERDAEKLRPLYERLGLTVGTIVEDSTPDARRAAYRCDITYITNKQLAFDYLKDRLVIGDAGGMRMELEALHASAPRSERLFMRGLCMAILDEADSVLVDEARTPLILSRQSDNSAEAALYGEALAFARTLEEDVDYRLRRLHRDLELTPACRRRLTAHAERLGGVWKGRKRRESLISQALSALHLFERDVHYLVDDGQVRIIDEYTGRVMADRTWEQGLHQLIELKEDCELTSPPETLARISYQRFFRRYLRLAGMTGTAAEVTGEFWSVYGLAVDRIPTHRPSARAQLPTELHATAQQRWDAVVTRVRSLLEAERAVLVGTRSLGASEALSAHLTAAGIPHEVLNARQDAQEAAIIAEAGTPGRVTVATNMAGRGTDIELSAAVAEGGGLHVIATDRQDARRIDRQLFGRAGRQGDPGSAEMLLSLEDELMTDFYPQVVVDLLRSLLGGSGVVRGRRADLLTALPQRVAEWRHARIRRALLKQDDQLLSLLAFSGRPE
ncbi:MAG TPA: hypothetical protein VLA56_15425 [Pseudomonadales bacterium]|nr:hypothetical protein [Pseudomonadales bacterium]